MPGDSHRGVRTTVFPEGSAAAGGLAGGETSPLHHSTIAALLSLVDVPPLVRETRMEATVMAWGTIHGRKVIRAGNAGRGGVDPIRGDDPIAVNGVGASSQPNSVGVSRELENGGKGKGKAVVLVNTDSTTAATSSLPPDPPPYDGARHDDRNDDDYEQRDPDEERWERWQPETYPPVAGKAGISERAFGTIHEWREICATGPAAKKGAVRAVRAFSTAGDYPQVPRYYKFIECLARFSTTQFEPWIARFYGWFESEDAVFVATEYFQHGDLGAYLHEHARLIEDDAADVIAQVLEGLTFVHDAGCAHRNIRPETVMIVSPGGIAGWKIKIGDFGISKPLEAAVHSTINGDAFRETAAALEMLGIHATSPAAAAATDGRGHVVREQSADIYHVGELAYLLLTREPPFADASGLTNYLLQPDNVFPSWIMRARGASDASVDFARVAMRPVPETRPTVRQALEHAWTKPRATTNVHFLAEPPPSYETVPHRIPPPAPPPLTPRPISSVNTPHILLTDKAPIVNLSFSGSSHLLLAVSDSGALSLWDLATRTQILTYFNPDVTPPTVLASLAPSGNSLVTGSLDGTVRLWNLNPGQLTKEMSGPTGAAITAAAHSPDGHIVATGDARGGLSVWDAATGAPLAAAHAPTHCAPVSAIAFTCEPPTSPSSFGRCLMASAAADGSVVLADVRSWTPARALAGAGAAASPGAAPAALRFSPDGRWLVGVARARNWRAWGVGPWAASASASALVLAEGGGGGGGAGGVWARGTEARAVGHGARHGEGFGVVDVAFRHSADGSPPGGCGGGAGVGPASSRFVVAAVKGMGEAMVRLYRGPGLTGAVGKLRGHERRPACLAFSPDGRVVASGAPDNTIRVWNTAALVGGK